MSQNVYAARLDQFVTAIAGLEIVLCVTLEKGYFLSWRESERKRGKENKTQSSRRSRE